MNDPANGQANGNGNDPANGNGTSGAAAFEAFTRLEGNVRGVFDDRLGPLTWFVGENQAGKSARLIAVRLAFGAVSRRLDRSLIDRFAPAGADELYARLSGPSGLVGLSVRRGDQAASGFSRIGLVSGLGPEALERALPAEAVHELLEFGSQRGTRAIVKRWGGEEEEVLAPPAAVQDLWNEGLVVARKAAGADASAGEVLSKLAEWAASQKKRASDTLSALDRQIATRRTTLVGAAAGAEQLPRLRDQLARAEAWEAAAGLRAAKAEIERAKAAYRLKAAPLLDDEAAAGRAGARTARKAELEAAVQSARKAAHAESARLQAEGARAEAAVEALAPELEAQRVLLARGQVLLECLGAAERDAQGHGACLLCGTHVDLRAIEAEIQRRYEARVAASEQVVKDHAAADAAAASAWAAYETYAPGEAPAVEEAERALATFLASCAGVDQQEERLVQELGRDAARIQAAEAENRRGLEALGAVKDYEGPTAVDLRRTIQDLEAAEAARARLEEDEAARAEAEEYAEAVKAFAVKVDATLNGVLSDAADRAEAAVNRNMVVGTAELDLESGTWLVRGADERTHDARKGLDVCGAEYCNLAVGLGLAWTEGSPLRVLLLDDRDIYGFSAQNLGRLNGLIAELIQGRILTQFIGCWSRGHELAHPKATIVQVGAPAPAQTPASAPLPAAPVVSRKLVI